MPIIRRFKDRLVDRRVLCYILQVVSGKMLAPTGGGGNVSCCDCAHPTTSSEWLVVQSLLGLSPADKVAASIVSATSRACPASLANREQLHGLRCKREVVG